MRMLRLVLAEAVLVGSATGSSSGVQAIQQPQPPPGTVGIPGMQPFPGEDHPLSPIIAQKQEQARNIDRQKRLVTDTDKLLSLATELKQEVDKTNKDVMSVDVIKKADEIEKLAHSVKERMKG